MARLRVWKSCPPSCLCHFPLGLAAVFVAECSACQRSAVTGGYFNKLLQFLHRSCTALASLFTANGACVAGCGPREAPSWMGAGEREAGQCWGPASQSGSAPALTFLSNLYLNPQFPKHSSFSVLTSSGLLQTPASVTGAKPPTPWAIRTTGCPGPGTSASLHKWFPRQFTLCRESRDFNTTDGLQGAEESRRHQPGLLQASLEEEPHFCLLLGTQGGWGAGRAECSLCCCDSHAMRS